MKTRSLQLCAFLLIMLFNLPGYGQNKRGKHSVQHLMDSSAVKIYFEITCRVDKDGGVWNSKNELVGKMDKEGLVRDLNGNIIGKREKTSAELIDEVYK